MSDSTPTNGAVTVSRLSRFQQAIREIGDGTLEDELSDALTDLVDRIAEMGSTQGGKPIGALTLKLKFRYDRGVFDVDSDVSTTLPKRVRPRSLMYPGRNGGLSRNDPRQLEAFRDTTLPDRERRDVVASITSGVKSAL